MKPLYLSPLLTLLLLFSFTSANAAGSNASSSMLRVICSGDNIGAEVTINGKYKGECPIDMEIKEGSYTLQAQKPGSADYGPRLFEQQIRMGEGVVKKVEIHLGASELTAEAKRRLMADLNCSGCPDMVLIPAGTFEMGSNNGRSDEKPPHTVTISRAFAMGKTEVTQGLWQSIMGNNPSQFSNCGDNCPVEQVSWDDVQEFIRRLNARTGKHYRLPSEAEWEYACRAGGQQEYCGSDNLDSVGWYGYETSGKTTHSVATKQANAWGLYDMSGNVWEWVEDSYHDSYSGAPTDGSVWSGDGARRVLRGGSWSVKPRYGRAAHRDGFVPADRYNLFGFRLARTLP